MPAGPPRGLATEAAGCPARRDRRPLRAARRERPADPLRPGTPHGPRGGDPRSPSGRESLRGGSMSEPRTDAATSSIPVADSAWVSGQVEAMVAAWARGEWVGVEEVLARRPGLGDEAAVRLIYEEVGLRREAGQEVPTSEVVGRFPRWKGELEVLLRCDRLLRPSARVGRFPEVGERLGPFRLVAELGRGASGRTYLGTEPELADRPVVLKLVADDQEEHLSLARLQHTHIVPLFSVRSFPERGLRALCMPSLGGSCLAKILDALADVPPG